MKIKVIKVDPVTDKDQWDQHLTLGKEYEVEGQADRHYMIRNDAGVLQWFFTKKFTPVGDSLSGKTADCESADGASTASLLTKFKVGDSFELPDKSTCTITEVETIPDANYIGYTVKHNDGEESVYGENLLTHARKI